MNIIRVTDSSGRLTCVRLEADAIGFRSLAGALRKLHGVSNLRAQNAWPLNGDEAIRFTFGDQEFVVETPFSEYCLQPVSPECPVEIFEQVASHLEGSEVGWLQRLL